MADLADVENALVSRVTAALYPNGLTAPSSVGVDCRIYRGWPGPQSLDADLKAGKVNVTIFPDSNSGQSMTRYPSVWHGQPALPTLIAWSTGNTVTFGGTAGSGQVAGILLGNRQFVYRLVAGDTPTSVAANLTVAIRARYLVQLAGASFTIPGVANIVVRVVADSPAIREIRRQSQDLRLSFWCPSPSLRDRATSIVDTVLAGLTFLNLPDTSYARITYKNTMVYDQSQSAALYRRDLIYTIEYPTTLSEYMPSLLFGSLSVSGKDFSV